MTARTVEDVILGEARARDINDMKYIASVITNRARLLGVTPEQVVANSREFNAYGKALPPGVAKYRDLARQALQEVAINGPVTNATFYATPAASKNLPKGLQPAGQTNGHLYYTDPKNRSINTAVGFRPVAMAQAPAQPRSAGLDAISGVLKSNGMATQPRQIRPGEGLANLVPNPAPIAAGKLGTTTPETQAAYQRIAGTFGDIGVKSGYRSPEQNRAVGGAKNSQHIQGRAVDLATKDMPASERAQLLAMAYDDAKIGGIGLYPTGSIHIDTRPRGYDKKGNLNPPSMWSGVHNGTDPALMRQIAAMAPADRFGLYGAKTLPKTGAPVPSPRPDTGQDKIRTLVAEFRSAQKPMPAGNAANPVSELLGVNKASASAPFKPPVRPITPTPVSAYKPAQPAFTPPQRPVTTTQQQAPKPAPVMLQRPFMPTPAPQAKPMPSPGALAAQYAQYKTPVSPPPVAKPTSNLAAQYAMYRPMTPPPVAPAATQPAPVMPRPAPAPAPVPPRMVANIMPKQAPVPIQSRVFGIQPPSVGKIGGAVIGGALGGPLGALAGGWLGNKVAPQQLPMPSLGGVFDHVPQGNIPRVVAGGGGETYAQAVDRMNQERALSSYQSATGKSGLFR